MSLRILITLALLAPPLCLAAPANESPRAEWTVLIFMNGDNNLEEYALFDFEEMAQVGSDDKINIIVQMDRNGQWAKTDPQWTQTLRFRIERGMKPVPGRALEDVGEVNMGSPEALRDFVRWGLSRYPARRTMLVIWDHGQGWKGVLPPTRELHDRFDGNTPPPSGYDLRAPFRSSHFSPYRSVSHDATDHDELFNSETASALSEALAGGKLDVLGFDACLMAMVESAYAFRSVAQVMVASEELEPGWGWQYDDWLGELKTRPELKAREVAQLLVEAYKRRYASQGGKALPDPTTTLSAIELTGMEDVATAISSLAATLRRRLAVEPREIQTARQATRNLAPDPYADGFDYFFHVDLLHFCGQLEQRTQDEELRQKLRTVMETTRRVIIANYVGSKRQGEFGASGLAIYFAPGRKAYAHDIIADHRYDKCNTKYPVEFVQKHEWADFLHDYFEVVP